MIETHDLTKMYGDLYALNRLNLTLNQGDVYGFIGPNGAGKTTTMRILATLLNPTWGEATVCGYSIYTGAKEIRRVIGYMPDFFGVYDDMKVIEYLEFFAAAYRIKGPARRKICEEVLELVDLTYKRDALVTSLSRGMTQRLGLARTLLHDPQVLLLDEPASGLDPRARIEMRALLKELRSMGKTILVSSHILPELADICNKIGIIEQGVPAGQRRGHRRDEAGPHRHRAEHRRRRPPDRRRQPAREPARGRERPGQERRPGRQAERGGQPVRLPRQPADRAGLRADPVQGRRDQPRDRVHAPDQGHHELSRPRRELGLDPRLVRCWQSVPAAAHSWGSSRMSREQPGKEHLYRDAVQATWLGLAINLLLGLRQAGRRAGGRFLRPDLRRGQFTGRRVHVGGRADCFPGGAEAGRRRASLRPHPGRGHRRLERRGPGDGVCPARWLECHLGARPESRTAFRPSGRW